ncbi:MAG: sensor histidine kinase [Rhizobiales bacterium]|nr:sensor histidine kinase [Hyphomicrobiales bacterium]
MALQKKIFKPVDRRPVVVNNRFVLPNLVRQPRSPFGVDAEPMQLSGSHAIALGMATHELITNAIKHAYDEGEPGPIDVSLKRNSADTFVFRFTDRGRGLPEDFQIDTAASLGMKMIISTARQLGGTFEVNRLEPGSEFVIHIPASVQEA